MISGRRGNARLGPFRFDILARGNGVSAPDRSRTALDSAGGGPVVVVADFARRLPVIEHFITAKPRIIESNAVVQGLGQTLIFDLKRSSKFKLF